ncbi:MAG TPA: CDP-alcohol phosphatidyltransferase family protein [Candidatus Krumholzibacteria bacterium]|nr:CDP-alcohol phosphatidyltransferase family protein [Candidatus Krumholzibacteria bacterium]
MKSSLQLVTWTLAGLALTCVIVWGVRRGRGARSDRLRVADWLTIARFVLIAPTVWLLVHDEFGAAAICYFVLGWTDVVDGMVARARRETSAFGMFLDPLGDILSTSAVFTVFVFDGLIPRWLYALMLLRYLPLAVASLILSRTTGPVDFRSTLPGKIVGVVQGAGALWIMIWAARGVRPVPGDGPLFAFLAVGFVSIVVSQTVIGYRHVRRAPPRARG